MDDKQIAKITQKVTNTYPEMRGAKPSLRKRDSTGSKPHCYVLTYKGQVSLPGSKTMKRVVRVVVDHKGKIVRMSTSK